jgi:hypothetical protein
MRIQKLGLEIRKIGNLDNLYRDVDLVLSKYQIKSGEINANVQVNAVAHSLQKMFKTENYFSVCCIRDCASLCQINISAERMRVYQTQHCVSWSEMTDDFRQMLVAMVLDDFRCVLNPSDVSVIE